MSQILQIAASLESFPTASIVLALLESEEQRSRFPQAYAVIDEIAESRVREQADAIEAVRLAYAPAASGVYCPDDYSNECAHGFGACADCA